MGAFADNRRVVTTAGTRVPLSTTSVAVRSVTICAETDNAQIVVVGAAATVVATVLTRRGIPLAAGDTITLTAATDGVDDLAEVGLDAVADGEGVTYVYAPA